MRPFSFSVPLDMDFKTVEKPKGLVISKNYKSFAMDSDKINMLKTIIKVIRLTVLIKYFYAGIGFQMISQQDHNRKNQQDGSSSLSVDESSLDGVSNFQSLTNNLSDLPSVNDAVANFIHLTTGKYSNHHQCQLLYPIGFVSNTGVSTFFCPPNISAMAPF